MSRERRFFVADLDASPLELTGDEAHHLVHVLRLGEGAEVVVFDGDGHAAQATVTGIGGDTVELEVGGPVPINESPLALTVAVAVPKGDTMALIVQKLTELGVTMIQPLVTDRGEMPADKIARRLQRWRRIALEAAKQCGRSRLPSVEAPKSFVEVAARGVFMLSPAAPSLRAVELVSPVILVGPEGGWSPAELELARARSVTVFGLGPRTLRTETAAIAAVTLAQWLAGDFR